jgi:hypothetical protein
MQMSGTDQAFWIVGFLGELMLACVLLLRRQYLHFPIFVTWVVLVVIEDPILFLFLQHASPAVYYRAYTLDQVLDYLLQFCVLVEIAHSVLKPHQPRLTNRSIIVMGISCFVIFMAALGWSFTRSAQGDELKHVTLRMEHINFLFSYLRLAIFAGIAGFSQMLGITWRNHVIRLAAGLAFYSAVSLIVQLSLSHLAQTDFALYTRDYWLLNHTQVIAYLCALTFWVWSFVQKDAPRGEFTPQMQKILVTIAQAARRDRVSLTRSMGHK